MDKTYWIHRSQVGPIWINLNSKNNGLPILMSQAQYLKIANDSSVSEYVYALPDDFWLTNGKDDEEFYINVLTEAGITRDQYLHERRLNYREQVDSFFKNGLYIQRPQIVTTATRLDEDGKNPIEALTKILKKDGFGFNVGNSELGALTHRDNLNVVFVLKIPKGCVSDENPLPVFEETEIPLEILTAYLGIHELTSVIPHQYISGAYVVGDNGEPIYFDNPGYDENYVIENGQYDSDIIKSYVKKQLSKNFDIENVKKVIAVLEHNFQNTHAEYNIRQLEFVFDFIGSNLDTPEAVMLYEEVEQKIIANRRSIRTPMEVLSDNLIESDLENLSEQEIVDEITKYLSSIKNILRTKYKENSFDNIFVEELDSIQNVLECVGPNIYAKIQNSQMYNDIVGEIEILRKILTIKEEISIRDGELLAESCMADDIRKQQIAQQLNGLENKIAFLNYAMCSNFIVAQNIITFLEKNDVSNLTYEECADVILQIKEKADNSNKKTNVDESQR